MKKLARLTGATILVLLMVAKIQAQTTTDGIKAQIVKDWGRAKDYTKEYLNTMPADKYSFKPADTIRTFAQQMLHLASANLFFMSNVSSEKLPTWLSFSLEQRTTAQVRDSVVYYVMASYDYAINAVKNSDVSKWGEMKKLFNRFDLTEFAIMSKAFEHQTHHRGQTTIYIRTAGIRPPQERLF